MPARCTTLKPALCVDRTGVFDKGLFRGFIQKLRELNLVWPDTYSKLLFDERLDTSAKDAQVILGRELRHTIERISPEATKPAPK